jgi:hypothetical protein
MLLLWVPTATTDDANIDASNVADGDADTTTGGVTLNGGDGANTLTGSDNDDVIDGGIDDDILVGGLGNDEFIYSATLDINAGESITGGDGTDTITIDTTNEIDFSTSTMATVEILDMSGVNADVIISAAQLGLFTGPSALVNADGSDSLTINTLDTASVGGTNADDTFSFLVADTDVDIEDFTVAAGNDLIEFSDLTNADLRGTGVTYEALNVTGGVVAPGANTGLIVNNGANSGDLTVGTQETDLAVSNANVNADDIFYYLTDDGTDSALFLFDDTVAGGGNGDGNVDAGEVTLVATFVGIASATTIVADNFTDFA